LKPEITQGYLCRFFFTKNFISDIQSIHAKVWLHDSGANVVITKDESLFPGKEPFIQFDNSLDLLAQSRSSLPEFEQGVSNQKALNVINGFPFLLE
jgi:hypothetical protein